MANPGIESGLAPATWQNYEPRLLAAANGAVTHPNLGDTPTIRGRYIKVPNANLVMAQIQITSSLTGVSVGSGSCYVVELPIPARRSFDGQIIGQGMPYRLVTGASYEWVCVAQIADEWTSFATEGRNPDRFFQMVTPWTMLLGTGTITASATSHTVTHNLGYAPNAADILVTLAQAPSGTGGVGRSPIRFTSITTTQFTFTTFGSVAFSTANQDFEWKIRAEPKGSVEGSHLIGPKYGRPFSALSAVFFQVYYEPA